MLTLRDYKVKAKKIVTFLLPMIKSIRPRVHHYKGYEIYENFYAPSDFYVCTKTMRHIYGSYKHVIQVIDHELTSSSVKIHARHSPPPEVN